MSEAILDFMIWISGFTFGAIIVRIFDIKAFINEIQSLKEDVDNAGEE